MEQSGDYRVLEISEAINEKEALILRAGVLKFIKTPQVKNLALDLSDVKDMPPQITGIVRALRASAILEDTEFLVSGDPKTLGDQTNGQTLDEAMEQHENKPKLDRLKEKEQVLKAHLENLKKQKETLDKKYEASGGDSLKDVRESFSTLNKRVKLMEGEIKILFGARSNEPMAEDSVKDKKEKIEKTIVEALQKEEVLGHE